jgi:hypothetical protein
VQISFAFVTSRAQIAYETGCNWSLRLGTLRIETATERLLPREVAPIFEREHFPHCGLDRVTTWKIVLFRRRLIVDRIRPLSEHFAVEVIR